MHVTVIGGAGSLGSTIAYTLATTVPDVELRLVDVDEDGATGHGTDVEHSMYHATHAVGETIAADVRGGVGPVSVTSPGAEAVRDTDCLVFAYNVDRSSEAVGRGGRDTYYAQNRPVADEFGEWMRDREPIPVVVVTNPMDRITYRLWKESGWPRTSFVGYSLSESARAAAEIGRLRDVDPNEVHCPMMGEHGETVVPILSRSTAGGDPVELSPEERQQLLDYVREIPYEVMRQRGPAESSRWVSGRGAAAIVHAIHRGGTDDPVCLSVPLAGEYGFEDVCMSVPVVLSGDGWATVEEWTLSDWETDRLEAAYEQLSSR